MPLPKSFTNLVSNLTILPGVGEKTALNLIKEYKSIDGVLFNKDGK